MTADIAPTQWGDSADDYRISPHKLMLDKRGSDHTIRMEVDHDLGVHLGRLRKADMPQLGAAERFVILALGVDGENIDEVWMSTSDCVDALRESIEVLANVERRICDMDWMR